MRADALRVLRSRETGHGVRAACVTVDHAVGVRSALPRSGPKENGGDSIPDETDEGDPAPPALAPRRHPSRVARPPVVAPPIWRWDRWPSGAANPAKRLRVLGVTWQHPWPGTRRWPFKSAGAHLSRSPSSKGSGLLTRLAPVQFRPGSSRTRSQADEGPGLLIPRAQTPRRRFESCRVHCGAVAQRARARR